MVSANRAVYEIMYKKQKSPGPPGWGLMQPASSSLITKNQKMLKNQTPSLGNQSMANPYQRNK